MATVDISWSLILKESRHKVLQGFVSGFSTDENTETLGHLAGFFFFF